MSEHVFSSSASFQGVFSEGLSALLHEGGLGPFILVCANASFDRRIAQDTAAGLQTLYETLRDEYVSALAEGRPIQAVEEDLLVFLKLHAVGFANLQATEFRQVGPWEVQFNQLRSFRPKRISAQVPEKLYLPFNAGGFHFNKPFLLKESFWSGELAGRQATLYYNKYPFVDFHALLVPERENGLPQYLTEDLHDYLWRVTQELSRTLPGVGFGYNSLGAFASVNHLHFQMFIKPEGLPVLNGLWRHNGGSEAYPLPCMAFDAPDAAWTFIRQLHESESPYNLLYTQDRLYVLPRKKQGCYAQPDWTSGFAWHEMAGGMITFNRDSFDSLDQAAIARELAKLAP